MSFTIEDQGFLTDADFAVLVQYLQSGSAWRILCALHVVVNRCWVPSNNIPLALCEEVTRLVQKTITPGFAEDIHASSLALHAFKAHVVLNGSDQGKWYELLLEHCPQDIKPWTLEFVEMRKMWLEGRSA